MAKAQSLVDKITANPQNPSPNVLHALATILETQESRYMEDADQSSTNNGRSSHNVGRLGNLSTSNSCLAAASPSYQMPRRPTSRYNGFRISIAPLKIDPCPQSQKMTIAHAISSFFGGKSAKENEELFELITSKFLAESSYSVSVKAATTRLLFSCSLTWLYPYVFEDDVLANLTGWVEEIPRSTGDDRHDRKDFEILCTYSTGLLAWWSTCGRCLNIWNISQSNAISTYSVLGNASTKQKDGNPSIAKSASTITFPNMKEEGRGRLRIMTETSLLDVDTPRMYPSMKDHDIDAALLDDPAGDCEQMACRPSYGDECGIHEELPNVMALEVDGYEAEGEGEGKCNSRNFCESDTKPCGKSHREEDVDEKLRDDSSREKTNCGFLRSQGKVRSSKGVSEDDRTLTSPSSGSKSGQARSLKDWSGASNQDARRVSDAKKSVLMNDVDNFIPQRDDNDDCFQNCKVGNKDITDLVKKAVTAAEAEARAANAPAIAIWAAGDAAAEVVKTAALEVYRKTNDEAAARLAASRAASTVLGI